MAVWIVFREVPFAQVEAANKEVAERLCDQTYGIRGWSRVQSRISVEVARGDRDPEGTSDPWYGLEEDV